MSVGESSNNLWWNDLKHHGALISAPVLREYFGELEKPNRVQYNILRDRFNSFDTWLRQKASAGGSNEPLYRWCDAVLEGFLHYPGARYAKSNNIPEQYVFDALTGEKLRPNRLLFTDASKQSPLFAVLVEPPVTGRDGFRTLGTGKGRTSYGRLLEYLRASGIKIGILTNGIQFRLCYAASDHDSWAEWDVRSWFEEEELRTQLDGFLTLLSQSGTSSRNGREFPLLEAIEASRSKQAELASVMGEQVRSAVELLIDHINIAKTKTPDYLDSVYSGPNNGKATPKQVRDAVYQAATRIIMRMVVVLFAEARGLLSRSQLFYEQSYGIEGLFEQLRKAMFNEGRVALEQRYYAWYRLNGLFKLIHDGCPHPDLIIQSYGGLLFRPGDNASSDTVLRAMALFENKQFQIPDSTILTILERLKIGRVKIKQGRSSTMVAGPVDFSDLKTEFIGMMYEGLLDFDLKASEEPLVILNLGQEPILPLSLLENKSDKELRDLITKLSKEKAKGPTSEEGDDEDENAEEESDVAEGEAEEETEDVAEEAENALDENDQRRMRAVEWAKKAAEAAKLVKKKKGEDDYYYQKRLDQAAQKLIIKVLDKDEFYLARWGGTRKGTGTFYTKPGLSIPTTRRTLEPLLYDQVDGKLIPKEPEDILKIKVCDPACGSASFLVAALHYVTDALYKSLIYHCKIGDESQKPPLTLPYGTPSTGAIDEDLPSVPPSDERFEDVVRSRLRRHVVERCIYGVDLNPMAVELARLSLWIETMDSELPFGFLDHKIKSGNSLVGCWFDQFRDYPLAAWLREGGNKEDTEKIKDCLKGEKPKHGNRSGQGIVLEEMKSFILSKAGVMTFGFHEQKVQPEGVHDESLKALEKIHEISIAQPTKREQAYREHFLGDEHYLKLKDAFDAWCAVWFWPVHELEAAVPSPAELSKPGNATRRIVTELAQEHKFFHWELEFPDVFAAQESGFNAIVGNPPWETMQPSSKEFFSNYDPVYRTYGKQEAIKHQKRLFDDDPEIEREWLNYNAFYKSFGKWMECAVAPFGDPEEPMGVSISLSRKPKENRSLHASWRRHRAHSGYADHRHPYRYEGSGKAYTYKMFLELSYALLSPNGRLGMLTPSGIYTDAGTRELRELFVEKSKWEWLFGFENRRKVFDIDSRFKFCSIIIQKGGQTKTIKTAFMRHDLKDWEEKADELATSYERSRISIFSPKSKALLELRSKRDIEIVEKLYANSVLLGDQTKDGWQIKYKQGDFNMTSHSHLFKPRPWWEERGYKPDPYGRWIGPDGDIALPLYEGRMVGQFDFSEKGWVRGKGRSAVWRDIDWSEKAIEPQYLMSIEHCEVSEEELDEGRLPVLGYKVPLMNISSATNKRTAICSFAKDWPCNHSLNPLRLLSFDDSLYLAAVLNSFVYDFAVRVRLGGLNLSFFVIDETPVPKKALLHDHKSILLLTAGLSLCHQLFSPEWLLIKNTPGLSTFSYRKAQARTRHERLRLQCMLDAIVAELYGLDVNDMEWILKHDSNDPKGFWRVDEQYPMEIRHTTLAISAFRRLKEIGLQGFLSSQYYFDDSISVQLGPRLLSDQSAQMEQDRDRDEWAECEHHALEFLGVEDFVKLERILDYRRHGQSGYDHVSSDPEGTGDKQGNLNL